MHTRPMVQESRYSAVLIIVYIFIMSLVLMKGSAASALEVAVSYSFPEVGEWAPPPASIVEGAIIATFSGDETITPIPGTISLDQVNSTTWTMVFPWNWTEPATISFVGASGDTVSVVASPQPVIPFGSETHEVMVFHLTTPEAGLWAPTTGIYVYGDYANFLQHGVEWERVANLDFFNPADNFHFAEPVGLRIHGGWSRRFSQKSFRMYFDDYGTSNEKVYDFFDGEPTTFQRLLLRTHRFPFNCFNSDILESIWLEQGHWGSRIAPAVAYLNDEYWGMYSLRERLDDEFFEITHGLQPGSYTFIKDGITEQGDPTAWPNFIATFAEPQDFQSHAWYADMCTQLNVQSYVDWLLINIYAATADNGFDANLAQLKIENEPWQFVMWDEDDTLFPQNLNADLFRFFASEDEAAFEANWPPVFYYDGYEPSMQPWSNMLRGFMQNSEFKALFFGRLDELLATELSPASLAARIDAMIAEQGSEMDLHAQRWNWDSPSDYTDQADALKSWTASRQAIVQNQATDFREEFRVPVELVSFQATVQSNGVQLTWETRGERGNVGFKVMRENPDSPFDDMVDFYAQNPRLRGPGDTDELVQYRTLDFAPNSGSLNSYYLVWFNDFQQEHILPWTESVWVADWDGLVFNEFMADNDSTVADGLGEFDDWLEIYNGSSETVVLDSLYITDDLDFPTRHQLSGGLQLMPGQHLMLWADGTPEQGSDHLGFRLSAAGEGLYLLAPDGETILTQVEFGPQVTDVSLARETDGSDSWVYSAASTPGASNEDPLTQSLLQLNELMGLNDGSASDELGEFDPWLEIFNPLPVPVSLFRLELKLTGITGGPWVFSQIEVPPGHKILWLDGQPEQGDFHAPFLLTPGYGSLTLIYGETSEEIDSLAWDDISPTGSLARVPDGYGPWQEGVTPTPGVSNPQPQISSTLVINEFMALNGSTIADETGVFEDWVEIYNPGPDTVQLGEMFLTDDLTVTTRWSFPDTSISAGEYMIVWCDSDPLDGPLHTNFKLSAAGEAIGLYVNVDEVIMLVDARTFGAQTLDVSEGRVYDGGDEWTLFVSPSPGFPNSLLSVLPPVTQLVSGLLPNYPNPFNPSTTIVFTLEKSVDVQLTVHDLRGRLVKQLVAQHHGAGRHQVVWDGAGSKGQAVASGVYLVHLKAAEVRDSQRILLLK